MLNILRKYKYHPYKTQCHQQIFAVDEESKAETCYEIQDDNDRGFLSTICFTDKSTFTVNNEPNVQNTRYWAQENPRVNIPTRTQFISGLGFLITFETKGSLNSANYLDLLLTKVGTAL
jgi:hypothetical protein